MNAKFPKSELNSFHFISLVYVVKAFNKRLFLMVEIMAKEKDIKIIAEKVCVSTQALYDILGVNESTLVRWAEKGCPKVQRGWWAIKDVLDWRNASFTKEKNVDEMNFSEQKVYYEGLLKKAQLEAVDLKNRVASGEYIAKDEIVAELTRFLGVLKRSMNSFSKKISTELSHLVDDNEARRMEKIVSEVTTSVLEQLSINGVYEANKDKKNKKL